MFGGLFDVGDDAVVWKGLDGIGAQKIGYFGSVIGDAGRVFFRDKGQFGVHGDDGAHVNRRVYGLHNMPNDLQLAGVGFDGFNAGSGLERIGRIDDQNPVAMAKQRHGFRDFCPPLGWRGGVEEGSDLEEAESEKEAAHKKGPQTIWERNWNGLA